MYDYMKALQKRFDRQEHSELDAQIKSAHEELRRDMDAVGRGKLLRLLDAQNTLLVEAKLMSFTAGFYTLSAFLKLHFSNYRDSIFLPYNAISSIS